MVHSEGKVGSHKIKKKKNSQDNPEILISRLINSFYYSISNCFIMTNPDENEDYRLILIRESAIIFDKKYRTLKGARIAFQKKFKKQAWNDKVVAAWTFFYPPDQDWLEDILAIADKFSIEPSALCN
jgi:hypothetical protein